MENLGFGLGITVIGMGIVFGLLLVLWLILVLVGRQDRTAAGAAPESTAPGADRTPPEATAPEVIALAVGAPPEAIDPTSPTPASRVRLVGAPADLDPAVLAAVTVAVLRHIETRRRQAAPALRSYWPGSLLFASRWVAAGRTRQARSWTRRAR